MSNVVLNAGSGGATLGTDQVAGTPNVDYQIVKVGFSAAGSAPVQTSATNPLPVAVNLSGTAASVNTGNADAGTQRVVLATNQPTLSNAQPVTQSGSWTVTVNGVVADATAFTRGTTAQLPVGGVVEAAQAGLTVGQTRALSLTTGALLRVDASGVAVPVTGTFWQATQPVSAASLPLPTGAAADSSVNGILLAQGSATSGQKGPLVQGAVTTGAPTYTTADTSPLSLTTAGGLRVDGSAVTQPVSGSVTANIGTTNGLALDASVTGLQVAQGSTTSGEKGPLVQGAVTTGSPSYTTGQTSPLSLDTSGNLRVNVVAGGASGGTSLADGSAFTIGTTAETPVAGTVEAAQSGLTTGKSRVLSLDTNGFLRVNVAAGGAAGGTSITDGAAFARGTTAETPAGGVAETSAPSLTTGKAAALSLNLSGGLRVDGSGVTQPVSGTFWQATQPVSGTVTSDIAGHAGATLDATVGASTAPTNGLAVLGVRNTTPPAPTNGQSVALQVDPAGNLQTFNGISLVTLSAQGTALNSTQTIIGNGISGAEAVMVQLTQTTTLTAGAVTFEVTYDGSNWSAVPANCVLDPTSATYAQIAIPYTVQASTNKQFLIQLNGATGLRIRTSTAITGTGAVTPNYALLNYQPLEQVSILGTPAVTQSGTWTVQPGNTANTTPWLTTNVPGTSPGSTTSRVKAAASTNSTNLKGSAGVVLGYALYNNTASAKFFKFYNKATAPTVGTDTPAFTVIIPASGGANVSFETGVPFATGIGYGITGAVGDSDATNTAVDDVHGFVLWK